ncbi:hypothetical protein LINPERHAP2_LOCUS22632 [Linum perenne]
MYMSETFEEWFMKLVEGCDEAKLSVIAVVMWVVWRERNERVWSQKASGVMRTVECARETVEEWSREQERRVDGMQGSIAERGCQR